MCKKTIPNSVYDTLSATAKGTSCYTRCVVQLFHISCLKWIYTENCIFIDRVTLNIFVFVIRFVVKIVLKIKLFILIKYYWNTEGIIIDYSYSNNKLLLSVNCVFVCCFIDLRLQKFYAALSILLARKLQLQSFTIPFSTPVSIGTIL